MSDNLDPDKLVFQSLTLNGDWALTYSEDFPDHFTRPGVNSREMLTATVPGTIHRLLMEQGLLDDPRLGLNSLKARWVEEQHWIYRRTFTLPPEATAPGSVVWLVCEQLEWSAAVWLNGEKIGIHQNAHRPARFAVTEWLKPGENQIVISVEAGLYETKTKPLIPHMGPGQLTNRSWQRKMQHQCGWDSQVRLMNVGILGDVRLEWSAAPRLDQVSVFATVSDDLCVATLRACAFVEGTQETPVAGTLSLCVVETGQTHSVAVQMPRGESSHEVSIRIETPQLWWPVGQGEPFRYTVQVRLETPFGTQALVKKTGIRRVELDQSPHPVTGRYFVLKINNRPIFCKGGNWIPADMLYSEVQPEEFQAYVALALEANFNFLRIWGGGLFAGPALCEACDAAGLLLWQDFLFACANYPGTDRVFAEEVRAEARWATRAMAHHPSLVVWCGNNELELFDWNNGWSKDGPMHPHYALFHRDLPRIVHQELPHCAYWISSPFSPDYLPPGDPTVGDQHEWGEGFDQDGWRCRVLVDRFADEGGFFGCAPAKTLRQFLPAAQQHVLSQSWFHHDNTFAWMSWSPEKLGLAYETIRRETGLDPFALDLDRFAYVGGLLQAEALTEYITNFRRRMFSSAAAVFWMFNDSWPTTNSWSIVDYYRRKKLAFHPVRRAFAPVTVVVAEEEGTVTVYGVNETAFDWQGDLHSGLFWLAGGLPREERTAAMLPANLSTPLASFPRAAWEEVGLSVSGAFAVLTQDGQTVAQHRLFLKRFGELEFAPPEVATHYKDGLLTLRSPTFVWGVCLDLDGEAPLSDNCFDLYPGIDYVLPWDSALGTPKLHGVGNTLWTGSV